MYLDIFKEVIKNLSKIQYLIIDDIDVSKEQLEELIDIYLCNNTVNLIKKIGHANVHTLNTYMPNKEDVKFLNINNYPTHKTFYIDDKKYIKNFILLDWILTEKNVDYLILNENTKNLDKLQNKYTPKNIIYYKTDK
jgi:hypothetical protein